MNLLKYGIIVFICLAATFINSLTIPYSDHELKTDANKISNYYRISPPDSILCDLQTSAWLWHNSDNLYILCELEINKDFVLGRYADKDVYVDADYFRVQLISDETNYYAYGYIAYPLGSKVDFIRNSAHSNDKNWNSNYTYASKIKKNIWTILFKIPFKDIRRTGTAPYNWKVLLTRFVKDKRQTFSSSFCLTKMGNDYFRRANSIKIDHEIRESGNFSLIPYIMYDHDLLDNEIDFDEKNVGLDIAFSPNVTTRTKLSLSPDFSDIPLDNVVDTYNSKYIPTYAENRYFFVEDFDAFGVGQSLFYSRNIVQPEYAFKFTTGNRNYSLGILSSKDKPIASVENAPDFYNIIAFKPVWDKFRCQLALLSRMDDKINDYHNEVLHLNPIWEAGKNKFLWSDLNSSYHSLNDDNKLGSYLKLGYREYSRHHYFSFLVQEMTKDYAADMGINYEDDFYGWNLDYSTLNHIKHSVINEMETSISLGEEIDNKTNKLLERKFTFSADLFTSCNLDYGFDFIYYKEFVANSGVFGEYFDKLRMGLNVEWDRFSSFENRLSVNFVHYLFYGLNENHDGTIVQYSLSGAISRYLSYTLNLDYSIYPNLPNHDYLDNEYWLGNFDLVMNISNKLSISQGLRYDDYEYGSYSQYLGYFANLRWNATGNLDVFAGYKEAMNKIDSENEIDLSTLFIKLRYSY
jgi:hypothetical protein